MRDEALELSMSLRILQSRSCLGNRFVESARGNLVDADSFSRRRRWVRVRLDTRHRESSSMRTDDGWRKEASE
jgi:hypothetical protein